VVPPPKKKVTGMIPKTRAHTETIDPTLILLKRTLKVTINGMAIIPAMIVMISTVLSLPRISKNRAMIIAETPIRESIMKVRSS
jgi:hypothetical protein